MLSLSHHQLYRRRQETIKWFLVNMEKIFVTIRISTLAVTAAKLHYYAVIVGADWSIMMRRRAAAGENSDNALSSSVRENKNSLIVQLLQ